MVPPETASSDRGAGGAPSGVPARATSRSAGAVQLSGNQWQRHDQRRDDQEQGIFPATVGVGKDPTVASMHGKGAEQDRYASKGDPTGLKASNKCLIFILLY